jgi:hypothetical protein
MCDFGKRRKKNTQPKQLIVAGQLLNFSPKVEPFNVNVPGVRHAQTFFFAYPL